MIIRSTGLSPWDLFAGSLTSTFLEGSPKLTLHATPASSKPHTQHFTCRCRANSAHAQQSGPKCSSEFQVQFLKRLELVLFSPKSSPVFQVKVLKSLKVVPSSLGSGQLRSCSREIGNRLPSNQRQCRTFYALCHILYPLSAAHVTIFQMDSNSLSHWSCSRANPEQ